MQKSFIEINERLDNLRCDLAATWLAIGAMQTVLSAEQNQCVLEAMAKASAQKQALYDVPQPTPEAQEQMQRYRVLMQQAEQRLYQLLQNAPQQFRKDAS